MDDESISSGEPDLLLIRIRVPEINVEKCLQFQKDELIWEVKQQSLAALPKVSEWYRELQESFNYGLFMPPSNGKAGKFLDEERRLSEYPFSGPIGYLELKYKRRVYKMLQMDEKQLKSINSKSNHKKLIENVNCGNVDKVNKMCTKGLDPNFHCPDSGETPLTLASSLKQKPARMLISLVNGGAILDFRTRDGSTALHKAVVKNNAEALRTLLELGASPNYKDCKGLTPLYLCLAHASDVIACEMLLHDHAIIGAQDSQGWQEVHQACRNGLVSHLEHLLFYGAELNVQNASGNTPLHVCAVNNQESCARTLLFRGADKEALNFAGQTPYQVAVIAGNLELADVIQNHKPEDVVPFKDAPKFNPRRRMFSTTTSPHPLSRTSSDASAFGASHHHHLNHHRSLESPLVHSIKVVSGALGKPPSPSPSDRSLPPFSSGSSVSETSTGSGGSTAIGQLSSSSGHESHRAHDDEQLDSASALAVALHNEVEVLSLSSGVGTSSQSGSAGSATTPTECQRSLIIPGMHVVCLENHSNGEPGSLHITQGDIIEVTGSTDSGMLEGVLRGQTGLFPAHCVQEVRLRNADLTKQSLTSVVSPGNRVAGRRETRHFATATRSTDKIVSGEPRSCVLHKGKRGFGFVLRGAKAASPLMEMIPSEKCPGLQYMDDVDPGGVADVAGILKGDFLLEINGEDVRQASHERVVNLIRTSGDLVTLTVITVAVAAASSGVPDSTCPGSGSKTFAATLPRKLQGRSLMPPPPPPKRDPNTTLSVGRARAKSMVANLAAIEALDRAINEHDSSTSDSVTGSIDSVQRMPEAAIKKDPEDKPAKIFNSVADMKRSSKILIKTSSTETNEGSNVQVGLGWNLHKDFHSTPELAAAGSTIAKEEQLALATAKDAPLYTVPSRATTEQPQVGSCNTTEDKGCPASAAWETSNAIMCKSLIAGDLMWDGGSGQRVHDDKVGDMRGYFTLPGRRHRFLDSKEFNESPLTYRQLDRVRPVRTGQPAAQLEKQMKPPPPTYPPPPPPQSPPAPVASQVIVMEANSEYARVIKKDAVNSSPKKESDSWALRSSFKPSDSAKLYASPEHVKNVAFREQPEPDPGSPQKKKSPARANSMPPRPSRPLALPKNEPALVGLMEESVEKYSVNGVNYTTYTTFRSPITPDRDDLTPVIPEPDYDAVSDNDDGRLDLNQGHADDKKKKKKKSVSFVMDERMEPCRSASVPSSLVSSKTRSGASCRKQESILKDSCRLANDVICAQPARPLTGDKYARPMDKIPAARLAATGQSVCSSSGLGSQRQLPLMHKVRVTDKLRIDVPPAVPVKSNLSRSNSSTSASTSLVTVVSPTPCNQSGTKPVLHKSQSFCAEKVMKSAASGASVSSPTDRISESDLQKARSQLKPSRSFPNGTQLENEADNSSSGVSSDQENALPSFSDHSSASSHHFVTYLPVSGHLPEQSKADRVRHPAVAECSERPWPLQQDRDLEGVNIVSMKKLLHPKLQAIFDQPCSASTSSSLGSSSGASSLPYSSQTLPSRSRTAHHCQPMSMSVYDEGSISHSLALIHRHVNGLSEVDSNPTGATVLAPPPGFSDSESFSDNDSLMSSERTQLAGRQFGIRGLGPSVHGLIQSTLTDQLKKERSGGGANFSTLPRKAVHKDFRTKPLIGWSTTDVCDWLDSLFMPEYKAAFVQNQIDGMKLAAGLTKADLEALGVIRVIHCLNIEKSLKRYLTPC